MLVANEQNDVHKNPISYFNISKCSAAAQIAARYATGTINDTADNRFPAIASAFVSGRARAFLRHTLYKEKLGLVSRLLSRATIFFLSPVFRGLGGPRIHERRPRF